MSRFLKICMVVLAAGFLAPSLAAAQDKSKDSTDTTAANSSSDSSSEFEKTRQHMIEKNKESQRTGKM